MERADPPFSAAAERNQAPILAVIMRVLPPEARVLEIASGTGQHAQHFAAAMPRWHWQPTDAEAEALSGIDARCAGMANVAPALRLDVTAPEWPVPPRSFDAVYCANMLHIAPWACCPALMRGAALHLAGGGGRLVLYGPYRVDGEPVAPSNLAFDADLRRRDPRWGLRSLGDVVREARQVGLELAQRLTMPANNLVLVFERAV